MSASIPATAPGPDRGPCCRLSGGDPELRLELLQSLEAAGLRIADAPTASSPASLAVTTPVSVHLLIGSDPEAIRSARRASGVRATVLALVDEAGERAGALEAGADDAIEHAAPPAEIALRAKRLFEAGSVRRRSQRQNRDMILVQSVARRFAERDDLAKVLRDLIAALGTGLDLGRVELWLADPGDPSAATEECIWSPRRDPMRAAPESPIPTDAVSEAIKTGEPIHLRVESEGAPTLPASVIPLASRGQACGILAVLGGRTGLGPNELSLIHFVCTLLANALRTWRQGPRSISSAQRLEQVIRERTEQLDQQRLLLQALVDTLPVSLHVIDRDSRVVVWNRAREGGALGRPRGEILGQSLFDVLPMGDEDRLRDVYEKIFDGEQLPPEEVRTGPPDSQQLYEVSRLPMHLDGKEQASHVVTIGRDVTLERRLQAQMAESEKMAAVAQLAAGTAHEINNPLATMAACAEALKGRLEEIRDKTGRLDVAEWRDYLDVVETEAYRCKGITGALLDFYRGNNQPADRTELIAADQIVDRTVALMAHDPRLQSVHLERVEGTMPPAVRGAEGELVQVLMALLHNAADASPKGGTVTVGVEPSGDGGVVIFVTDEGDGVPEEARQRLFEPFFTTKAPGQGTGLGLTVAYGIVKAHGGSINLTTSPGTGARFEIRLPPADEETDA